MKIAFLTSSYAPNFVSGAEKVVQILAEAFVERGHQAVVITTQPVGKSATSVVNGVRTHYLPVRNIYRPFTGTRPGAFRRAIWHTVDSYNLIMGRAVGRILDEEKPDVVNSHNITGMSSAAFRAVKLRSLPLVHTLHDQYFVCSNSMMFKRGRNCKSQCPACRLLTLPRRLLSQKVDVAVGVSQFIIDRHLGYGAFRGADVRVIYNGSGRVSSEGMSQKTLQRDIFRFGFLGRIHPTKGLQNLIEKFITECAGEAELWIGGGGDKDYEAQLRARTSGIENIRWLGRVNAGDFLGTIDVLVVPSLWQDTAPLVVLEAFAHGVPVLGANRGGIPEFITSGTGWLYEPDEPDALRNALRECLRLKSELRNFGENALAAALRFNGITFVDRYLDAYRFAQNKVAAQFGQ